MLFVAVAAVAAWVAVGRLASATERALARTEASIALAVDLAETTAASAKELEKALAVVGDGLGSTGEALGATQQVSENVRRILGIVDFFDRVDDLNESLVDAESSLAMVEASLASASGSVSAAAPALRDTVRVLQKLPAELERSLDEARAARERIGDQTALWRLAIAAGAVAVLGGLWSIRRLALAELRR